MKPFMTLCTLVCAFCCASGQQPKLTANQSSTDLLSAKKVAAFARNSIRQANRRQILLQQSTVRFDRKWCKLSKKLKGVETLHDKTVMDEGVSAFKSSDLELLMYQPFADTLQQAFAYLQQVVDTNVPEAKDVLSHAARVRVLQQKDMAQAAGRYTEKYLWLQQVQPSIGKVRQQQRCYRKLKKLHTQLENEIKLHQVAFNKPLKHHNWVMGRLRQSNAFLQFFKMHSSLAGIFATGDDHSNGKELPESFQTKSVLQQQLKNRFGKEAAIMQFSVPAVASFGIPDKALNTGHQVAGALKRKNKEVVQKAQVAPRFRWDCGFNMQYRSARQQLPAGITPGIDIFYEASKTTSINVGLAAHMDFYLTPHYQEFSAQGVALRAALLRSIGNSLWLSGGYEGAPNRTVLQGSVNIGPRNWQHSGLVGLQKELPCGREGQTSIQILWDYLSYWQQPQRQPILLRTSFKLPRSKQY